MQWEQLRSWESAWRHFGPQTAWARDWTRNLPITVVDALLYLLSHCQWTPNDPKMHRGWLRLGRWSRISTYQKVSDSISGSSNLCQAAFLSMHSLACKCMRVLHRKQNNTSVNGCLTCCKMCFEYLYKIQSIFHLTVKMLMEAETIVESIFLCDKATVTLKADKIPRPSWVVFPFSVMATVWKTVVWTKHTKVLVSSSWILWIAI